MPYTNILLAVKVTTSAVVKKDKKKLKKFRRDGIQTLTSALSKIDNGQFWNFQWTTGMWFM